MIHCGGNSDLGYNREINEDFVHFKTIDENNDVYFAAVADGAGTISGKFQSSSIAVLQIEDAIQRVYSTTPDALLEYPGVFLSEFMVAASRSLGIFRVLDEEKYYGFAASLSCALIVKNKITIAHSGNTRVNLFRFNTRKNIFDCVQVTKDQTKGMELVNEGRLSFEEYHLSPDRLIVTGGLGLSSEPNIQVFATNLKNNDFVLFTTDGIHYAIRPDVIFEIIKRSANCEEATKTLIEAAKLEKYEDNMSALLIWNTEGDNNESSN